MTAEYLVEDNLKLIDYVINKYTNYSYTKSNPVLDEDDLKQAGAIGLIKAARNWDESKGTFATYAVASIRNAIFTEFKYQQNHEDTSCFNYSLDEPGMAACENMASSEGVDDNLMLHAQIDSAARIFSDKKKDSVRKLLSCISMGYSVKDAAAICGMKESQARGVIVRIRKAARN